MGTTPATKGSRERDINHTLDIYRCYIQDWTLKFCENFYVSQTQRRVNAFHYVLDYNLPPNARFVWLCHIVTQPYSARRRLHLCLLSCKNSSDRDNPGTRPYSLAQRYEVFLIHTELLSINVRILFPILIYKNILSLRNLFLCFLRCRSSGSIPIVASQQRIPYCVKFF